MELTILTPTYNRKTQIKALFQSLQEQTVKDFEWLIVDDGSSDNTREVIDDFKNKATFEVSYIYKPNGGKHTALNVGIREIDSELTFIVDSDDTLTPDAVETILKYHNQYRDKKNLCGFSFLRMFPNGKINGKPFKEDGWIVSYVESRINSGDHNSDKAEIYYTSVLREYPFPEFPGEKFLGEDIVWVRIARKYAMVHINKGIYIGAYLNEGLTSNRREHNIKSPYGCMNRAKEFLEKDINPKVRFKSALQYVIYGYFAGLNNSTLLKGTNYKFLVALAIPPGSILHNIWNRKYKSR